MKKFAERLIDLRLEKGLTKTELAKAVSLSQNAIYCWENQMRTPNAKAIIELARFFDVTTDYLLGEED